jgi:hypothetical protein
LSSSSVSFAENFPLKFPTIFQLLDAKENPGCLKLQWLGNLPLCLLDLIDIILLESYPYTNYFRTFHIENIIHHEYKISYLKEEVSCTEPSPSVSLP